MEFWVLVIQGIFPTEDRGAMADAFHVILVCMKLCPVLSAFSYRGGCGVSVITFSCFV